MRRQPGRGVVAAAAALVGLWVVALGGLWITTGQPWFRDAAGTPQPLDFMAFHAIGLAVFEGRVAEAYDPDAFAGMLEALGIPAGQSTLRWLNPPHFALLLVPFALLPLDVAFLAFLLGTALLLAATLRLAVPCLSWPAAMVFALASPAAYAVIAKGQNGFLTAALIGAGLLLLDRRPVLAGICIGMLAVKPQFGVLLPALLVLGRHWVAAASAAVTVAACVVISAAVLGPASWLAFARSIGGTGDHYLGQGAAQASMHSVHAVLAPHLGSGFAALAHATVLVVGLALVAPLWRHRAPPNLRNAATLGLAFLATPYAFNHDLPMLVVGAAILAWGQPAAEWPAGCRVLLALLVLVTPLPIFLQDGAPGAVLAGVVLILAVVAARRLPMAMPLAAPDTAAARTASHTG